MGWYYSVLHQIADQPDIEGCYLGLRLFSVFLVSDQVTSGSGLRSESERCWVDRSTKTDPIHILRRNLVLGGPPEAAHVVEQSVHIVHCAHPGQCWRP